jgi:hypothetical protein
MRYLSSWHLRSRTSRSSSSLSTTGITSWARAILPPTESGTKRRDWTRISLRRRWRRRSSENRRKRKLRAQNRGKIAVQPIYCLIPVVKSPINLVVNRVFHVLSESVIILIPWFSLEEIAGLKIALGWEFFAHFFPGVWAVYWTFFFWKRLLGK